MYLTVNAKVNNPLNSYEEAIEFIVNLAIKCGFKISNPEAHYVTTEGNQGVTATGVIDIDAGKVAFHIWDETQPATLDFEITAHSIDKTLIINAISRKFDTIDGVCKVYAEVDGQLLEETSF